MFRSVDGRLYKIAFNVEVLMTVSQSLYSFCLIAGASVCAGQTSRQGAIAGTVTDPSGAVIPSVQLTATNLDQGVTTAATANHFGEYRFNYLVPGRYQIAAKADGFE